MVTGEYGSITASNVAYFQVINGLKVTGWVNDETYNQILGTEEMIIEPKDTKHLMHILPTFRKVWKWLKEVTALTS